MSVKANLLPAFGGSYASSFKKGGLRRKLSYYILQKQILHHGQPNGSILRQSWIYFSISSIILRETRFRMARDKFYSYMTQPKINLINPETPLAHQDSERPRRRRYVAMAAIIIVIVAGTFFTTNILIPSIKISRNFGVKGFWEQIKHLTFSRDRELQGQENDRINILLLGVGGQGHNGPYLTDTIILTSIQPSTGRTALLSIPRDLSIPYPDGGWRRINEAYSIGQTQMNGQGGEFSLKTISTVLGIQIPYYAVVDFNGFKKVIDELGGIRVMTDRSFTDRAFPTMDEKVQTVSFVAGWQWFDGKRALQFARSRHGDNNEGSDFARAKRQQKVLLAVKDRILASQTLLNPITINRLASNLGDNLKTNMEPWEIITLYSLANKINTERIVRASLDAAPGGFLTEAIGENGAYLLQPKGGDFSQVQRLAQNIFTEPEATLEPARIEVQNGTSMPGLAADAAEKLERLGFTVTGIRNADNRPIAETTVYDLTNGAKPSSLATVRVLFNAKVASTVPDWLSSGAATIDPSIDERPPAPKPQSNADFIIIIGADSATAITGSQPRSYN